ncbi:zinc-binding alcohol dehydrogenase family protein [uncultured Amnibacterium sp.]|uniref:quinone oxidoreductase family protein n=1 Tax=uncultured Amnibacterium sp. TaxID=1631851 RepID=UPI0035CC3834
MDSGSAGAVMAAGRSVSILAAFVEAPGEEPRMRSVPVPERVAGTTSLRVLAAPLNPLDLLIASGTFHSARHDDPYVPGSEFVGVVEESDTHAAGSLMYGECHASPTTPGAFAEWVVVADDDLLPLPTGVDPVLAAAVGNSGIAAFLPMIETAQLRPGETVLVLGATGAVGRLAVQIARQQGAGRVVGLARNVEMLEQLPALGADAIVALRADEDADALASRLREAIGSVDVVLDCLYGTPLEAALQVCAPHARVVNVGHSAGHTARIAAGVLRGQQIRLIGFAGLHTPLAEKRAGLEWLWRALASGRLRTEVTPIRLDELPAAWRAQARSPHTKYVVVPNGTGFPGSAPAAVTRSRKTSTA